MDRGRDLVGFGGGKDKYRMGRRLLKGLQEGIKGAGREHVDLIHDVDLIPP